jgi:hypothetical protein
VVRISLEDGSVLSIPPALRKRFEQVKIVRCIASSLPSRKARGKFLQAAEMSGDGGSLPPPRS